MGKDMRKANDQITDQPKPIGDGFLRIFRRLLGRERSQTIQFGSLLNTTRTLRKKVSSIVDQEASRRGPPDFLPYKQPLHPLGLRRHRRSWPPLRDALGSILCLLRRLL